MIGDRVIAVRVSGGRVIVEKGIKNVIANKASRLACVFLDYFVAKPSQ